jgi:hypothetical protein
LAANTIEEHILDVAEQKRKFADSSITGGEHFGTFRACSAATSRNLCLLTQPSPQYTPVQNSAGPALTGGEHFGTFRACSAATSRNLCLVTQPSPQHTPVQNSAGPALTSTIHAWVCGSVLAAGRYRDLKGCMCAAVLRALRWLL